MQEKERKYTERKGTKTVIAVMTVLVLFGILIAYLYYNKINKSEDPRVVMAKVKYGDYNQLVVKNDFDAVFKTLDTIEQIYLRCEDYKNSYEMGVVQNNKAAAWLTLALIEKDDSVKFSYLDSAKQYTEKGIEIFMNWQKDYQTLERNDIIIKISGFYDPKDSAFKNLNLVDIINKRTDDIIKAQTETNRRLSVAYTNLATIFRHSGDYEKAILLNKKALGLWPDNLTAKNNINILLGRPIEERTAIEKLFPKDSD